MVSTQFVRIGGKLASSIHVRGKRGVGFVHSEPVELLGIGMFLPL